MEPDQPPINSRLKNLPDADLEFLWSERYKEDGKKNKKLTAIQAEIPLRYGFTVSLGVLSGFYVWLRVRRRIQAASNIADTFKEELAKDPSVSDENLDALAAKVFKTEMFQEGNAAGYLAVAKFQLAKQKHKLAMEKLSVTSKTKTEAGLEALLEEIQGNPNAIEIFNRLKEVLDEGQA